MSVLKFVKGELSHWSKLESIFFPLIICFVLILSFLKNDSVIALISSICGITYTIFAGKGKLSCYFFGITATICYSYLAFENNLWGNFALNMFYYLPVSVIGVFLWKKNLKKDKQEIKKIHLTLRENIIYLFLSSLVVLALMFVFRDTGNDFLFFDFFTTVFSALGMFLTVKRCIEQWYVWFFVNIFSAYMWFVLYLEGQGCLSIVVKWLVYAVLAVYFLRKWKKELA